MAIHRCSVWGCWAEIIGMDDMPPDTVVVVFSGWQFNGRLMLCPAHSCPSEPSRPLWQWKNGDGDAASVAVDGALNSHGDLHAVAVALGGALADALRVK